MREASFAQKLPEARHHFSAVVHVPSHRKARLPLALALGVMVQAGPARAEQFILLDATIDYTWEDAENSSPSLSHFYVNDGNYLNTERPENWLSPVDYRNGTLHVRTEVFEKPPGDQQVGWTLCYIPNSGGYGCADTTYYTSTGVFDRETAMTEWWNNGELDWEQGIKQMDLIYAIDDSGSGHITNYPELKDLTTPTRVRITMVQVSAGSTYDPSILELPGGEGGTGSGGASAGAGGMAMMPSPGGSSGMAGGGFGGLLGMSGASGSAGSPAASGGDAGTAPSSAAGAPNPVASSSAPSESCAVRHSAGSRSSTALFLVTLPALALRRRRRPLPGQSKASPATSRK